MASLDEIGTGHLILEIIGHPAVRTIAIPLPTLDRRIIMVVTMSIEDKCGSEANLESGSPTVRLNVPLKLGISTQMTVVGGESGFNYDTPKGQSFSEAAQSFTLQYDIEYSRECWRLSGKESGIINCSPGSSVYLDAIVIPIKSSLLAMPTVRFTRTESNPSSHEATPSWTVYTMHKCHPPLVRVQPTRGAPKKFTLSA